MATTKSNPTPEQTVSTKEFLQQVTKGMDLFKDQFDKEDTTVLFVTNKPGIKSSVHGTPKQVMDACAFILMNIYKNIADEPFLQIKNPAEFLTDYFVPLYFDQFDDLNE